MFPSSTMSASCPSFFLLVVVFYSNFFCPTELHLCLHSHLSSYLTAGPTLLPSYVCLGILFSHLERPPCQPRPSHISCVCISAHEKEGWYASSFIPIVLALWARPEAMVVSGLQWPWAGAEELLQGGWTVNSCWLCQSKGFQLFFANLSSVCLAGDVFSHSCMCSWIVWC